VAIAEYGQLDGLGLAAAVQRGDVTAAELLEEAIARAERVNPRLGAIVGTTHDQARRQAVTSPAGNPSSPSASSTPSAPSARPFAGVPFLLKDLYAEMAGVPATGSSRYLADYRPKHDATIVTRFRRAGLIIFGKTNTPELGLVPATEPKLYGPARNPWNPQLSCGGSSGGAAAAVAAGIVPFAHANDGGGSIRIPAACCGLFGLKPTRGRTPVGPDRTEIWNGYTIGHVISRSVRDSAAALDAIAGPESNSPYWAPPPARPFLAEIGTPPGRLRVALTKRPQAALATPHADCLAAADDAGRLLADLGHEVEEADLEIDAEAFARDFFTLVCVEMAAFLARAALLVGRRARRRDLETSTAVTAILGRQRTALEAAAARDRLDAVARRTATFFERYDLLLSPTLGAPPPAIGALAPRGAEAFGQALLTRLHLGVLLRLPGVVEASVRRVFSFIPFSPLANVTGQPAMSVPLLWNADGLPIGSQLTARFGDEATLFRVAAQLETARPWRDRRPPLHADA
jgi:amidase